MPLTTLAKVKQFGQIDSVEDDLLLTRMIDSATAEIESYCSRSFASAARAEVRDGTGTRRLSMRHFPITAVASLTINGQVIAPRPTPTAYGYTFDDYQIRLTGYVFEEGVDNVEVVYTAGLATISEDLQQACAELVVTRYKARDRIGVSSKSLAGESISFVVQEFPDSVIGVLDRYRMVISP
jgi:hypothetical protein